MKGLKQNHNIIFKEMCNFESFTMYYETIMYCKVNKTAALLMWEKCILNCYGDDRIKVRRCEHRYFKNQFKKTEILWL